jgi:hypothetical protein
MTDKHSLSEKSYTRDQALFDLICIDERQKPTPEGYRQIREDDHIDADDILLRLIDDDEITEVFERIGKWYA